MKKIATTLAVVSAAALMTACGGGGGSSGAVSAEYQITLQADKVKLPVNVANVYPGISVYSPFTTVLHVNATVGGAPIPNMDENTFACNISSGLKVGALYYLDGKDEHMVEIDDGAGGKIKVPGAYRNITLGANAGGNSFHFHSGDEAGAARITCSVMDPRDRTQKFASVDIEVGSGGGTSVKRPANIAINSNYPGVLGTHDNVVGMKNQSAVVVQMIDDANQPVPSTGPANLQVSIRSIEGGATGARLVSGSQSGSTLHLKTEAGGTAQFSVISGNNTGMVVLDFATDRADNNVENGIADLISSNDKVYVLEGTTYLLNTQAFVDLGELTTGIPFNYQLVATNGLPPYKWTVTGLPKGLSMSSDGLITGTVADDAPERTYTATAVVGDRTTERRNVQLTMKVVRGVKPEDFFITNCPNNGVNVACRLPAALVGDFYTYAFSASVTGVTWEFSELPDWLKKGTTGANGYIAGKPEECTTDEFLVTAKKGASSVTRKASITITGTEAQCGTAP